MSELVTYIGNCVIGGEEFTTYPDGSKVRNLIRLKINERELLLKQKPDFVRNRGAQNFRGQFVDVTSLHFPGAEEGDIPKLLELSNQICELLSFATESRVVLYGNDFPEVGAVRQRRSVIGSVETFRPPFTPFDGAAIKRFIEICFPNYVQNRDPRSMNVVFDYLYHACKTGMAIEVKLASLFILLENLKQTYARHTGHPFINGYFRNLVATTGSPGPKLSFQTLLNAMFSAVGMNPSMDKIVRLRNELIHSGLIAIDAKSKFTLLEEVQDIIREYILRLLNFIGTYHCYSKGHSRTIT